ncbi:hypothetical protein EHV15_35945 [Paenibacillus oralis]|uniref:Uncharacterized protein n=1 Tax=Paenibacillus oralis TaxID=2490856 RepID=A0A3P3TBR3_9BACL|nr:hypothetical protein [Paenibacillus oralis]RRJ54964.1 hypothetical protein EHV15_35945 [Paenibacillus oralis]
MEIKEYTILNFKGMNGSEQYNYDVLQLNDDLYFCGTTPEDGIIAKSGMDFVSHFAPNKTEKYVEYLKKHFDENGRWRNLEACACCGRQISRPTPNDSNLCYLCREGFMGKEPLVGHSETAEILGWDKRKVSTYLQRAKKKDWPDGMFPKPIQWLASGPIWFRNQIIIYRDAQK